MATESTPTFDIPKECIAGVVKNEGPDFYIEVENVPVPEIGRLRNSFQVGLRGPDNHD